MNLECGEAEEMIDPSSFLEFYGTVDYFLFQMVMKGTFYREG